MQELTAICSGSKLRTNHSTEKFILPASSMIFTPGWNVSAAFSVAVMVSCLRLLMPDINIAATTALQAIDPEGREKALEIGANVIMPNITPLGNRGNYRLYENKPGMDEGAEESTRRLMESVKQSGCEIQLDTWGDSLHFQNRVKK